MVNIYLFIELLGSANAGADCGYAQGDEDGELQVRQCRRAVRREVVAQLDCMDSTDGDKAILNKIAKVDGVVQTNIIAVVRPRKG